MGDEDKSGVRRGGGRVLVGDVEVGPFGETPGRGVAAFECATDLAQGALQSVAVAVGLELVVEVEVEPVPA